MSAHLPQKEREVVVVRTCKCDKNDSHTLLPSWGGAQRLPPVSGDPEEVHVAHTLSLL